MSDVHPINSGQGPGGVDPSRKNDKRGPGAEPEGPSFAEVLHATTRTGKAGEKAAPGANKAGTSPLPFIGPVGGNADPTARHIIQRVSENFFRLVESFQKQLGNSDASMKDIFPLLREMEQHREDLLGEIQKLPQGDPGRAILEEMATLVSTESAKFHRGEYA